MPVITYLPKPRECTPRMNSEVKHKLWMIMCQGRFILAGEGTGVAGGGEEGSPTLVSNVDNGRGHACVGLRVYGKF